MRQWLRLLHRWLGLAALVFLILAGATGSLLAFEHEIDEWLNPELLRADWTGPALNASELTERIEAQDARLRVSLLPLNTLPGRAAEVQVQARSKEHVLGFDRLLVNPSTGVILGSRKWGAWVLGRAHLMPLVNRFHRSLTMPQRWGHWLMGSVALVWLLLSVAGVVLSLPVKPSAPKSVPSSFWRRWKPAWQIKRGAKGFRWMFDLHRALGLWMLPLFVMLAFSGASLNLGNEIFKPVLAWFGSVSPHPVSSLPAHTTGAQPMAPSAAVQKSREGLPLRARSFEPWYISYMPQQGVYRVAFQEPGFREQLFRVRYEQVFIDAHTGLPKALFGYDSGTRADRFLVWQYPLHSGKALGLPGRIVVGLSGLLLVLMAIAGLQQWRLRRRAANAARQSLK